MCLINCKALPTHERVGFKWFKKTEVGLVSPFRHSGPFKVGEKYDARDWHYPSRGDFDYAPTGRSGWHFFPSIEEATRSWESAWEDAVQNLQWVLCICLFTKRLAKGEWEDIGSVSYRAEEMTIIKVIE